jgi:ADP-ribosyl-[dinitrogen reductase] hydrolase
MELIERFRGCLLGLACGDALGAPIEFMGPDQFDPVVDFRGGGVFGVQPGQWTDDTSMALCLADSLIRCRDFDPADQMQRYLRWYREGYLSSVGACFDIGSTTREALERFGVEGEPYAGSAAEWSAGNGCLMRLAPVPMFYFRWPSEAISKAALSARTTHGAQACLDACRVFSSLVVRALQGESKKELTSPITWTGEPLHAEVAAVACGSYRKKQPPQIKGSGYVVESLEAALWAFYHGEDFADCVRRAANLGHDADTTAAICGQLAGAHYGEGAIPARWLAQLHWAARIRGMADQLHDLALRA